MSLPKIVAPEHEIKLFSLPKPIKFRPYLVKEEKLLLMASQGDDSKEVENAVRQIVRNCTFDKINADTLPTFDLEYLFLQLRGKSVNNIIELKFQCQKETDGKKCGALVEVNIDVDDIKLTVPDGHTNNIKISDSIGVILKYPTHDVFGAEELKLIEVLPRCIAQVYQGENVYEVTDPKEAEEFVESLNVAQIDKLRQFFETMPHLSYTFTFSCPKCGYTEEITLSSLMDFFG